MKIYPRPRELALLNLKHALSLSVYPPCPPTPRTVSQLPFTEEQAKPLIHRVKPADAQESLKGQWSAVVWECTSFHLAISVNLLQDTGPDPIPELFKEWLFLIFFLSFPFAFRAFPLAPQGHFPERESTSSCPDSVCNAVIAEGWLVANSTINKSFLALGRLSSGPFPSPCPHPPLIFLPSDALLLCPFISALQFQPNPDPLNPPTPTS